jgi:hypothetical protein
MAKPWTYYFFGAQTQSVYFLLWYRRIRQVAEISTPVTTHHASNSAALVDRVLVLGSVCMDIMIQVNVSDLFCTRK